MIEQEQLYLTRSGIVRGRSWTRQILSDTWESTDWEKLFDNPLHTVITETKLATEDQPRMLVKELLEVECRRFYVLYASIEAHGHMGSCPRYSLLVLHGKATTAWGWIPRANRKNKNPNWKPWQEKPAWNIQGQNRWEKASPREEKSSNWARYSGGGQHEEKRMRCIRVNIRGNERRAIGRMEEDRTTWAWSSEYISIFRSMCCPRISCELWDTRSAGVRTCAEARPFWRRRANFCYGCILREGWTKESLHRKSVGMVSRRRCWRSHKKRIGWEVDMSHCSREGIFKKWSENSDEGEKLENLEKVSRTSFWMEIWFRTAWWMENWPRTS